MTRPSTYLLGEMSRNITNASHINTIFSINRPDIYGLINILYIKADANLDQTITLAELGDVFHGFDKNGKSVP